MNPARIQPPKPETTRAFLVSAGIHRPTATLHHHFETKRTRLKSGGEVWEYLFKCFKTGAIRRWGIVNILGIVEDHDDESDKAELADPHPEAN